MYLKFITPVAIITLAMVASAANAGSLAGGAHEHAANTANHGGIYIKNKSMDIEVVAKTDVIQVYISDHGKPLALTGAKAKVTLLNGAEKSEVELAPAGDKLEAKGVFKVANGTKGVVLVTREGKPGTTARFTVK